MAVLINLVIHLRHNEIQEIWSYCKQLLKNKMQTRLARSTPECCNRKHDSCGLMLDCYSQPIFWDTDLCLYSAIHYIPLTISTKYSSFLLYHFYYIQMQDCIQLQINPKTLSPTTALITHAHGPEMTSCYFGNQ